MAPKRRQRMMLSIATLTIILENDTHRRSIIPIIYLPSTESSDEFEKVDQIAQLPIGKHRLKNIQNASITDSALTSLKEVIGNGWPAKSEEPCGLRSYFHFRDELNVQDGLVFKGHQIVVPHTMCREIREALHSSHMGIEGCLRRARE